jgi:hypothetical protein
VTGSGGRDKPRAARAVHRRRRVTAPPAPDAAPGPADPAWRRARALVLAHGRNAVAYQILNPGIRRWFAWPTAGCSSPSGAGGWRRSSSPRPSRRAAGGCSGSGRAPPTRLTAPSSCWWPRRCARWPPWLALALRRARAHGRRFYDFGGLDAFKAKFRPEGWEAISAIADGPHFPPRALWAIAGVFGGGSPALLAARALGAAAGVEAARAAAAARRSLPGGRGAVAPDVRQRPA